MYLDHVSISYQNITISILKKFELYNRCIAQSPINNVCLKCPVQNIFVEIDCSIRVSYADFMCEILV